MQSDIDAQLTSFFEETPPRDFAKVMRGYAPHQVDEHIRQLATGVRRHQEDAVAARRDLNDAHRQIQEQERPTYSGLGARIEQLLRLAEEQATELVQAARSEANEIKAAIEATLSSGSRNRGLWFDGEMLRFCGGTYQVASRVERLIDERSGRLIELRNPCVILDGVTASGEYLAFCPQNEAILWREIWLERAETGLRQPPPSAP